MDDVVLPCSLFKTRKETQFLLSMLESHSPKNPVSETKWGKKRCVLLQYKGNLACLPLSESGSCEQNIIYNEWPLILRRTNEYGE